MIKKKSQGDSVIGNLFKATGSALQVGVAKVGNGIAKTGSVITKTVTDPKGIVRDAKSAVVESRVNSWFNDLECLLYEGQLNAEDLKSLVELAVSNVQARKAKDAEEEAKRLAEEAARPRAVIEVKSALT